MKIKFNKLIICFTMAILSGCETMNQASQCDPNKNYLISNQKEMEKYQKERKDGQVKSIYFYEKKPKPCLDDRCVKFDMNALDFIEKNFDDEYRKGNYKITISMNKDDPDCMKEDPYNNNKNYCFKTSKNKDNVVYSSYMWSAYIENEVGFIKFDNIKENINLYTYAYQVYSTRAIGGPGFGTCKNKDNKYPYKFNVISFPMEKFFF